MSKRIDVSPELNEFDRQYLRDRNINPDEYELPEDPASVLEPDEEDVPYTEWTKAELKTELRNRRLIVSGDVAALIARLEEHDLARAAAEAEGDDDDA